ncbi:MAG: HypC/HybG/HupF family hydrogenase formation chaperone [Sedimenticolaceae bacterium]
MCIGVPVQVVDGSELTALCRGRNGDEQVTMLLVGEQPAGTWVLNFLGWAREVISEQDAHHINMALDGLGEIMNGAESIDVDHYFPGLGSAAEAD